MLFVNTGIASELVHSTHAITFNESKTFHWRLAIDLQGKAKIFYTISHLNIGCAVNMYFFFYYVYNIQYHVVTKW